MAIFSSADGVQCPANISHPSSLFGDTSALAPNGGIALLNALWRSPDKVHQIGGLNRKTRKFTNTPVKNAVVALARVKSLSGAGIDSYFAPAEYLTSTSRTASNVASACAFWVDLDVGSEKTEGGKGYATVADARSALQKFCAEARLPLPTHTVSSGSGLHAYWALSKAISVEFWPAHAQKLKAITKALNFFADDTRTADIASVLRVPGTLNHKYDPPRPVELLSASSEFIPTSTMLRAIGHAHSRLCPVAAHRHSSSSSDAGACHASGSASTKRINLRLLRSVLEHLDADCGYDDWFRIAAAVFYETGGSEDGFDLFDDWSRTGSKYRSRRETMRKWTSLRPDHPRPVTIATLRRMVEANGHDWLEVSATADEEEFEPGETVVIEPGHAPVNAHLMGRTA